MQVGSGYMCEAFMDLWLAKQQAPLIILSRAVNCSCFLNSTEMNTLETPTLQMENRGIHLFPYIGPEWGTCKNCLNVAHTIIISTNSLYLEIHVK